MSKQNRIIDWLIAGCPSLAMGLVIALLLGQNIPKSVGIGLATTVTSLGGAAILNRRQTSRIDLLQQQITDVEQAERLKAAIPSLQAQYNQLVADNQELQLFIQAQQKEFTEKQDALARTNVQLAELDERVQHISEENASLRQQKKDLDRRIAAIQKADPDLETLELLLVTIEQAKLEKSQLEGQINALDVQLGILEEKRRSLLDIEANIITGRAELEQLTNQVQYLQIRAQELEKYSAKLEFIQGTYDELLKERENLEKMIKQLKLDLDRLESQKNQLKREIEAKSAEYALLVQKQPNIETIQQEIQRLQLEKKGQELEYETLKTKSDRLKQEIATLEDKQQKILTQKDPLQALKEPLWPDLDPISTLNPIDEQQFLEDFFQYVQANGFYFSPRVIRAFHTSLKVQGISALVILAGISGTGKSELPQLYAKYIGAKFLMLAVQPRWDSPQDLLGFYNYMENQFKPTPLIQGIYQYTHSPNLQDRIAIVLLDEMNLARVEYYFSEFLSKLESRRNHNAYLEIDFGSLLLSEEERKFRIPEQFLFVGTMNEDETTQTLSDKVLDRANVIAFGRPMKLQLGKNEEKIESRTIALTYSHFKSWIKTPQPNSAGVKQLDKILTKINQIMEEMGHPFAHRVYQSIVYYAMNYPGAEDIKSEAFKSAIADQLSHKILPKLRGLIVEDDRIQENLNQLGTMIKAIGDSTLETAFAKARQGYQFQWKGLNNE